MKKFTLGLGLLAFAGSVQAFDAGPHQDLMIAAMADMGFTADAFDTARLANWLVDYYSNTGSFQSELGLLHFDNLPTTHNVKVYWGYLANNTRRALQKAATSNDPGKALMLLGMSLHAVQDFYTHSTWAETHPAPAGKFLADTYWTTPPADNNTPQAGVYTGLYPGGDPAVAGDGAKYHGSYTWGVNHDNYNRTNYDNAYVFAYSGTVQWLRAVNRWVEAVKPGFFRTMMSYRNRTLRPTLDLDNSFLYYLSDWAYDPTGLLAIVDGRWKAFGSGSVDFAACLGAFKRLSDDYYTLAFKLPKVWFRELIPHLDDPTGNIPAVPSLPKPNLKMTAVYLATSFVKDRSFWGMDYPFTATDFYAVLQVGNQIVAEPVARNLNTATVNWRTIKMVPTRMPNVGINYKLMDEDVTYLGGFQFTDEQGDINPGAPMDLTFNFNMTNDACTGDVSGTFNSITSEFVGLGAQTNPCTVRFYVKAYPIVEP